MALHLLMADGDVFEVDGYRYLVAPISDKIIETLAVAAAAGEDGDDAEPAFGWANEGPQFNLVNGIPANGQEDEPSLGWQTHGSQSRRYLLAGYTGDDREGDPRDRGEPDHDDDGVIAE